MKRVALVAILVTSLSGCVGSTSEHSISSATEKVTGARPLEWSEVFDAVWDVVEKNDCVWMDRIQVADGKTIEQKLKAMDPKTPIMGAKHGIVLGCHVRGTGVEAMTAFRRELRNHPALARHFQIVNFVSSWGVTDQKEFAEKHSLDFEVIMVSTGQATKAVKKVDQDNDD